MLEDCSLLPFAKVKLVFDQFKETENYKSLKQLLNNDREK